MQQIWTHITSNSQSWETQSKIIAIRNDINKSLMDLSENHPLQICYLYEIDSKQDLNLERIKHDYTVFLWNLTSIFREFQNISLQNVELSGSNKSQQEKLRVLNKQEKKALDNDKSDFQNLLNEHQKLKDIVSDLKWKNESLSEISKQNEDLSLKNEKLKKKIKDIKSMQSSILSNETTAEKVLFEENLQLVKKVDQSKETIRNLKEESEKNNQKIANLKEKNSHKKQKIKQIKSQIQILENKKSEKSKMVDLHEEIEKIKEENKSLREENETITVELKSLKKQLKKTKIRNKSMSFSCKPNFQEKPSSSKHHISNKSLDSTLTFLPYDLIINIDSLKSSKVGWEIENHKMTESYLKNSVFSIVGFVGRENIGKTFILNKLCGFDLPSGTNVNTKGLSLKYAIERNLICLDSAGMQTPVYYYDTKLMKRYGVKKEEIKNNNDLKVAMLNDRTLTDIFIQDFILEVSEVIIIVVGQLTQNDQKLIERISNRYGAKKKILIIHNFANLNQMKDVEKKIDKDIKNGFDVIETNIPQTELKEYIEKSHDKIKDNITHLVLGNEKQESGAILNEKTFDHIKNNLDTLIDKKEFDLMNELNRFIGENWHRYLRFQKRPKKGVSLVYDQNYLKIQVENDYEISNPLFNSLGTLVINPPYEVFIKKSQYICLMEIAELEEDSLNVKIDTKTTELACLIVQGTKKSNRTLKESNLGVIGFRNYGEFLYRIPLGPAHIKVKFNNKFVYKQGVLKIKVDIDRSDEKSELL